MATRRALLLGGVFLALGLLFIFWPRSDRSETPQAGQESSAQQTKREAHADTPGQRSAKNSSWITGIVVDRDTQLPLAGARIALNLRRLDNGLASIAGRAPGPRVAQSDNAGAFRFEGLSGGQYSVSIALPGYLPLSIDKQMVASGRGTDPLRFEMVKGGHRLYGKVTDIGGGAVAFAFVRAKNFSDFSVSSLFRAPFTAMTNADGEYELYLGDGRYQVDVFHDDYQSEKQRIAIGGQDREADFVLTPGSGIDGRVLRVSDNTPVEGAMVSWTKLGKTRGYTLSGIAVHGSALTDEKGNFSLRGLGNGSVELRAVSAHAANKQALVVDLAIAEIAGEVTIYVDEAYTLSGHIVSSADEDQAESGVIVGAYNISPGALFAANTPSLEDGYFEIHGVHPGYYTLGAAGEERLPNFFGTSVEVVDNDITDLVVTVDHGNTISGRVSPPQETSLALQINVGEIGFSSILGAASSALVNGRSDAQGNFRLLGVGSGHFTLVATSDTGDDGTLEIDVSGDLRDLVVPIEARATASGTVVDSDGQAVAGVRVEFSPHDKPKSRSFTANGLARVTMTGADGAWQHPGLKAGDYDLTLHDKFQLPWANAVKSGKMDYQPVLVSIQNGQDPPSLHLVVESRSHWITGTVRDSEGLPLADSWVTARWDNSDSSIAKTPRRRQNNRPVLSDDSGAFRIEGLRSGHYQLWASALHGNAKGGAKNVAVDSNIEIQVKSLGEISGSVSIAGAPVEDFLLTTAGPTKRRVHVRDSSGKFSIPKLEAGKYTLSCSSEEGVATATISVKAGESTTHNFSLSTFGAVFGTLVDGESGDPLPDMAIIATVGKDRNQWVASAMTMLDGSGPRTNDKGEFRIERLNAGQGTLFIFDPKATGFTPLVQQGFSLELAQSLDLGTLKSVRPAAVDDTD